MANQARLPRIAFVGNCQAQSLESLSAHLGLPIDVVTLPPNFDTERFGSPATFEALHSCDYVCNQRVADDYPVEFARPAYLRERFGDRSISWPNVYFDGYFPGIEYLYSETGKIMGPLSDYHLSFVRAAWAQGVSVDDLVQSFESGSLAESFRQAPSSSIAQLRNRETGLSVRMSDVIVNSWRHGQLMYTMNHPSNPVLYELLRRLMNRIGINLPVRNALLDAYPYTLDEIRIPAYKALHRLAGLGFEPATSIKGKQILITDATYHLNGLPEDYQWHELFAIYYKLYDALSTGSATVSRIIRNVAPLKLV